MCGHHGQAQARRQLRSSHHVAFIVHTARTLQLDVKPVWKQPCQAQGKLCGARLVPLQESLAHGPSLCPGQSNQPFRQLFQPGPGAQRQVLDDIARPRAREQFGQIEVALAVLHQDDQA